MSDLHVITMISNHAYGRLGHEYQARYRLYEQFKRRLERAGIPLWTCEVAFGQRPFRITQPRDNFDQQLRTQTELWHKERALQLMIWHLTETHPNWKYVAWIDADVEFANWEGNHSWFNETIRALHHFKVVQLFQNAIDLGPNGEALHTHTGFAYSYRHGLPFKDGYSNWHPGFAWAARRETIEATPLIDFGILGSGDRHMACGWIGKMGVSVNKGCSPGYIKKLMDWEKQAERYIRRDIGYVPGTILHHWHGRKKLRGYQSRWQVLCDSGFDPYTDIMPDTNGLWRFVDHGDERSLMLRDKVRDYFAHRNDDSVDLE